MNACVHTYTKPQTSSTRSRGLGRRIHGSVEDTKLSTNKQHTLSHCFCLPLLMQFLLRHSICLAPKGGRKRKDMPHAAFGWRIHCSVEVTESSTNKQHTLSSLCACRLTARTRRYPLRDKIREVGRGLSLADTQTGRYVRLYSRRRLCARRVADARLLLGSLQTAGSSATSSLRRCFPKTYLYRYSANTIYVTVSRINAYCGGVLARALPEGLRYLST